MNEKLWWYVARSTGIVAWALVAAAVVWGLLLTTRLVGGRSAPRWLLDLHRFLGGLAVIFTGLPSWRWPWTSTTWPPEVSWVVWPSAP